MTVVLGLSLGAATAIFSLIDAALLNPLPYRDPGELVEIRERLPVQGGFDRITAGDFVDLARESRSFEDLAAILSTGMPITSLAEPMNPLMRRASAGYFRLLGVEPILGRTFRPQEDVAGGARVTVLSHELWQSQLGGDREIVGRTIGLDGEPYTIVGVLPEGFRDPRFVGRPALWLPLALTEEETARSGRRPRRLTAVFGRLAEGVSLAEARAEVERLGEQLAARRGGEDAVSAPARIVTVESLREVVVRGYRSSLLVLFAAVLVVVTLSCGNFAHLLLARAFDRRQEIAVRTALGAGRRHVARLLLAEGLCLALTSLAIGLLVASLGIDVLVDLLPQGFGVPRLDAVALDRRAVGFAAVLGLACGICFALTPLVETLRGAAGAVLGGRTTSGPAGRRRRLLIVGEIALSLTLLASAGALFLTLSRLTGSPPGFDPRGVFTLRTSARGGGYGSRERWGDFYERVGDRLEALPGVEAVGGVNRLSIERPWQGTAITVPGLDAAAGAEPLSMVFTVTPAFFDTLEIPLLHGRRFTAADGAGAAPVAIVSREAARRYFAGPGGAREGDAVGREMILADEDVPRRIVGVVGDVRHGDVPPVPQPVLYVPHAQNPMPTLSLAIRTSLDDPSSLAEMAQRTIWDVSRDAPIYDLAPLAQLLHDLDWQPRFLVQLVGGFALLALVLSACGLYAVLCYLVSGRLRELGIRSALGASRSHILGAILGEALWLAALGVAASVPLTFAAGRLLSGQLIGGSIWNPAILAGATVLLTATSLLASFVPARQAARADPVSLLREP